MNPTNTAIWAGIIRQLVILIAGALIARGIKLDDSAIEAISGAILAIGTAIYSARTKQKLHGELAAAKAIAYPDTTI